MLDRNHGGLGDVGMGHDLALELDSGDPFATGLDQVLSAVGDPDVAVAVDGRDVAGAEPAIDELVASAGVVVVVGRDPVAAHLDLADRLPVPGQLLSFVVRDAQLDPGQDASLAGQDLIDRRSVESAVLGQWQAQGCEGIGLGHPPGVDDADAELFEVGLLQGGRHRRAAADDAIERAQPVFDGLQRLQHAEPDRGHAKSQRHLLLHHELGQDIRHHESTWHHQARARHQRRIGLPPRVGVEHGHNRQRDVVLRKGDGVDAADHVGVEHVGAVAVDDALRVAGGPRRVAHGAGVILGHIGKLTGLIGRDQFFVVNRSGGNTGGIPPYVVDYDHLFR